MSKICYLISCRPDFKHILHMFFYKGSYLLHFPERHTISVTGVWEHYFSYLFMYKSLLCLQKALANIIFFFKLISVESYLNGILIWIQLNKHKLSVEILEYFMRIWNIRDKRTLEYAGLLHVFWPLDLFLRRISLFQGFSCLIYFPKNCQIWHSPASLAFLYISFLLMVTII